jgi:hypothetical protein
MIEQEFMQNGLSDEANFVFDGRYKIYYPLGELPSIEDKEHK